ncbi:MAG: hypothetical protein ACHP84_05755 [Caulobacterales bacterium]
MSAVAESFGSRARRLAPFFLAGPISGPLLAGVVLNFRGGRPVLGTLYAIALIEVAVFLPLITAKMGLALL